MFSDSWFGRRDNWSDSAFNIMAILMVNCKRESLQNASLTNIGDYPYYTKFQHFQVLLENSTRIGKISSRPASISIDSTSLLKSLN